MSPLAASFEAGCIADFNAPFTESTLPPARGRRLVNLIFDVSVNAVPGTSTRVELLNDRDASRVFNILMVNGFAVFPRLKESTVQIVAPE